MFYMVEINFPHPERQAEFDAWYDAHLTKIITVPGFLSAQRFVSVAPAASPNLAIYALQSAEVLTSAPYKAKFGPQAAGSLGAQFTNWFRNILSGMTVMPEIPSDGWIAVMDRRTQAAPPLEAGYTPLTPVGLDRSIAERGLLIGGADRAPPQPKETKDVSIRVFKPASRRLVPAT